MQSARGVVCVAQSLRHVVSPPYASMAFARWAPISNVAFPLSAALKPDVSAIPRALNAWEQARGFAANTPEAAPELESKQGGRRKKKDSFRMTQASVPVERVTVGPIDTFKPVAVLPEEQGTRRNIEAVVRDMGGKEVGTVLLKGDVFDVPIRADLVHEVVVWQLACRRQGTHRTKSRAEVKRTGRKPHNQKGTGRARQGDLKGPHHSGGGHAHARRNRDYSFKMNKKVQRLALCATLSARLAEGSLLVIDRLEVEEPRTKWVAGQLRRMTNTSSAAGGKPPELPRTLVVGEYEDEAEFAKFVRGSNNLQEVEACQQSDLNVYSILHRRKLVITRDALISLQERLTAPIVRIRSY